MAEAEEKRLAAEAEEKRLAREEREAARRHEMDKLELEVKAAEQRRLSLGTENVKSTKFKLSAFDDSREQVYAYIVRFERFAESQGWTPEYWATALSALLKGEALNVYYRLSQDDSSQYEEVKNALLKRYEFTEEGFRSKFRKDGLQKGESFRQFANRLALYLDRWIELSKTQKDFKGLRDLLLREQVLNVASRDLRVFLKERQPENVDQMAQLAEQYLEVHGKLYEHWAQSSQAEKGKSRFGSNSNNVGNSICQSQGSKQKQERKDQDRKERTCYICHKSGHFASACRSRSGQSGQVTSFH